jgi:hypothetical protein
MISLRSLAVLVPVLLLTIDTVGIAQVQLASSRRELSESDGAEWNMPFPTMGGRQFWTDHRWWFDWKVQYNSTLDHWRLLDPNGIRTAWGTREAVLAELDRVKETRDDTLGTDDEVVLLVHGLFRSGSCMQPVANSIQHFDVKNQKRPRRCITMTYASTRNSISDHSTALRELVENLPGSPRISFVGHSLGNIVFRHAIGQWQRNGDPVSVLPRLNRAVMLGPPNQGSSFAKQLSHLRLFETVTGSTGLHLGPKWEELQSELGTPPCPFAILIGDMSGAPFKTPWLAGASDWVVTVDEAILDGASEMKTFPVLHSFLMSDASILKALLSFLDGGTLDPKE